MKYVNNTSAPVGPFKIDGKRYVVKPGGTVEIPDEFVYIVARRGLPLEPADGETGAYRSKGTVDVDEAETWRERAADLEREVRELRMARDTQDARVQSAEKALAEQRAEAKKHSDACAKAKEELKQALKAITDMQIERDDAKRELAEYKRAMETATDPKPHQVGKR